MDRSVKRIAVTGGAGQIAYSLLFRIAHGDLFGSEQPVALRLLDIPEAISALEGVRMELEDCAFPLLKEIRIGSDPEMLFEEADLALLVGAKPRGPGMERSDLLAENGKIFVEHGKALNRSASREVLVLVVGNPCNTNCLIAMHHAPELNRRNFHAMTRLDQNRAKALLARKAIAESGDVTRVTIWGNHSSTQVPDFRHALIRGHSAAELIADRRWLEHDFIEIVQKRGAEIIKARGKSSAASAANAAVDAMCDLIGLQKGGDWFSSGVSSEGNPYGIREGLIFSFPCRSLSGGHYEIVEGLDWDDFLEERIRESERELLEERDAVKELLKGG